MSLASESKHLCSSFIPKLFILDYLNPTLPFRLFKNTSLYRDLSNPKLCLPYTRFTDPTALTKATSRISIWSESHLEYLKMLNHQKSQNIDKVILKNPFKTQKLIKQSIQLGLKNMVVDSFEQLWKIHECRCQNKNSLNAIPHMNFFWRVSDFENDSKQLQTLNNYNIKVAGLVFQEDLIKNKQKIIEFIRKTNNYLGQKRKISTIYLQTKQQNFRNVAQTYQTDEFFLVNKIEIVLEKVDFKMTQNTFIAARVIGQNKKRQPILNQEAYNYMNMDQVKKGQIFEGLGRKWIFSPINQFPEIGKIVQHQEKGLILDIGEMSKVKAI